MAGKTTSRVERRSDVSPEEGEHRYGDVKFADTTNNKYPIDTPEHIRAAWNYIHHKDNAAKYAPEDVESIKKRIRSAAKQHDITINEED